jgi:septal ring-binding cell division protein DamX
MEDGEGKMDRAAGRRGEARPSRQKESGKPQGGGGTQWALVVAGVFILSLVAFISGVQMGKGLSDFKHTGAPSVKAVAKGPKGFPFRTEVKGTEVQNKEKVFQEKVSPPPEKTIPPIPEGVKATPPPKAQFTLQVAALSNPEEARELVNQLRSKGYAAYQVTGSAAAKGTLYRVRIGQFQSLAEARQFALAFEKKEKIKTIIASLQ